MSEVIHTKAVEAVEARPEVVRIEGVNFHFQRANAECSWSFQAQGEHRWPFLGSDLPYLRDLLNAILGDQPAAYVPKVGDVVKWADGAFPGVEIIIESINGIGSINGYEIGRGTESGFGWPDASYVKYVRPATPAERVSAGLDQPAASDDEACEVCACRDEGCTNPKHANHPTHKPAVSETPAVKFKVGDKVRVREFHDRTGEVVGDLRDRYYRVRWDATNDIGLASPGYIEAAPPASPARSERPTPIYDPIAIKIVDHMNKCGYFDDDAENIAGAYSEVHHLMRVCANATPAPRDEAKYAKDLADEYVMGVATVGCREDGIARNAYVAGWLACARARDGGR